MNILQSNADKSYYLIAKKQTEATYALMIGKRTKLCNNLSVDNVIRINDIFSRNRYLHRMKLLTNERADFVLESF